MIKIELEVADPQSTSGFVMGDLRITGEDGNAHFYCMVVLSATLLMDQLLQWCKSAQAGGVELNPVDCSGFILFQKEKGGLGVWIGKKRIARVDIGELLQEIVRACRELSKFVSTLPQRDAGRGDFEVAFSEFSALAASVDTGSPP